MQMLNLKLLAGNNFRVYNYEIAKQIGVNEAILFADLVSKYNYFRDKGALTNDGFFFSTADDIYETTALTRKQQEKSLRGLAEFVETKVKGVPAKKHFRLKFSGITKLILLPEYENAEGKSFAEALEKEDKFSFNEKVKPVLTKGRNLIRQKVETINNINNNINKYCNTASPVAVNDLKDWDCREYFEKMIADKNRHITIIGKYFKGKDIFFPSKLALQDGMKRYYRVASSLAEYPDEIIDRVAGKVKANKDWGKNWTLDTILKRILAGD
jgi:hypothetical protein